MPTGPSERRRSSRRMVTLRRCENVNIHVDFHVFKTTHAVPIDHPHRCMQREPAVSWDCHNSHAAALKFGILYL